MKTFINVKQFSWTRFFKLIGFLWITFLFFIRRPYGVTGGLIKCSWCFLFFSPPNLRAPSADRRETLPHERNQCLFYKLTPKIPGALPPKNWGPKTCKISVDFIQPPTLIANISGTPQNIQNLKTNSSMAIPPASNEKGPVNFGPLVAENKMWVRTH